MQNNALLQLNQEPDQPGKSQASPGKSPAVQNLEVSFYTAYTINPIPFQLFKEIRRKLLRDGGPEDEGCVVFFAKERSSKLFLKKIQPV